MPVLAFGGRSDLDAPRTVSSKTSVAESNVGDRVEVIQDCQNGEGKKGDP